MSTFQHALTGKSRFLLLSEIARNELMWNNTPRKRQAKITVNYLILKDITMNKLHIYQIDKNNAVWGKISMYIQSPCGIRTLDIRITSTTIYPLGYGVSYMFPSINPLNKQKCRFNQRSAIL